jgi:TetR/AcrR family transcriptional regulator, transcriptional repressor for nem operon
MGIAIINELLKPVMANSFIEPLTTGTDPLTAIYQLMHHLLLENKLLKPEYGCPAANFTQEMSNWNRDFNTALNELSQQWQKTMIAAIDKGKKNGAVKADVNAKQVTTFVLSGYWGIRNLGKLGNSKAVYTTYLKELKNYLSELK